MNTNTYTVQVTCWNCKYKGPVEVPKGRRFNPWGWGEVDVCPNCELDELHEFPPVPRRGYHRDMFGFRL